MYYLDFATIIELLKEFRRSGILRAELPKGIVNTKETCWIQLKLLQGEVIGWQVVTSNGGKIATDQNVISQVEYLGPLEWTFGPERRRSVSPMNIPNNSPSSKPLPMQNSPFSTYPSYQLYSSPFALVPRRLTVVEQHSLSALTRQQRRILALVDGKRNVRQIATLLFSPSNIESGVQEVFTLLQELEAIEIITLR